MDVVRLFGFLLLQGTLVSAGMQICRAADEEAYSIIACGDPGMAGQPGTDGTDGQKGVKGDRGLPGIPGSTGADGISGLPGAKGNMGDGGPLGPSGLKGPSGGQGAPGLKGDKASDLDTLKARVAALVGQVQDLQSSLEQQRKVSDAFKKTVRIGGKLYTSTSAEANYTEATAICANAGGSLATPHNSSENDAILSLRNYYATNAYLGINDLLTQGVYRYLYGEAILYTNWAPSEPNNLPTEFCVEMYNTGKWNNKPCNKTALVICEF